MWEHNILYLKKILETCIINEQYIGYMDTDLKQKACVWVCGMNFTFCKVKSVVTSGNTQ